MTKYVSYDGYSENLKKMYHEEFDSCVVDDSTLVLSGTETIRAFTFLEISRVHTRVLGETNARLASCLHRTQVSGSIEMRITRRNVSPIFCLTEKKRLSGETVSDHESLAGELVASLGRRAEEFKGVFESVYEGLVELRRTKNPKEIVRCFLGQIGSPSGSLPGLSERSVKEDRCEKTMNALLCMAHSEHGVLKTSPVIDRLLRTLTTESLILSIIYEPTDPAEHFQPEQLGMDLFGERFREACRTGAWNARLYLRLIELGDREEELTAASLRSRVEACLSQDTEGKEEDDDMSRGEGSMRMLEVSDQRRANREMLLREVDGIGEVLTSSELSCFLYPYDLGSRRSYRLLSTPLTAPSQEDLSFHSGEKISIGLILDCLGRPIGRFEIAKSQLRRHLCILGVTGSGKTTTGLILALELSKSGVPVVILDRTGEYARSLPRFSPKAKKLVPGEDLVIPPFKLDGSLDLGEQIEEWVDTVADFIEVSWGAPLSPSQARILRLALEECYSRDCVLTISDLVKRLRAPGERVRTAKWWNESSEAIVSRIEAFTTGRSGRVFDSSHTRLEPASLFNPLVTTIDLSSFSDDRPKNLFSQLFSRRLRRHIQGMGETTGLRLVYLIDEAQHIAPQRTAPEVSSRMFVLERFAVELRKYGVGLVTMVTRPTMISKNILANSNTIINHCLFYEDDVKRMTETLGLAGSNRLDRGDAEQCLRTLEPGEAIVKYGSYQTPFLVKIGTSTHRGLLSAKSDWK